MFLCVCVEVGYEMVSLLCVFFNRSSSLVINLVCLQMQPYGIVMFSSVDWYFFTILELPDEIQMAGMYHEWGNV